MLIVTTVGISLFENAIHLRNGDSPWPSTYKTIRDHNISFWEGEHQIKEILGDENNDWFKALSLEKIRYSAYDCSVSAEISSLKRILQKIEPEDGEEITIHLLASDTVLSVVAAVFIQQWFAQQEIQEKLAAVLDCTIKVKFPKYPFCDSKQTEQHIIRDLRIDKQEVYYRGFYNLLEIVGQLAKVEKPEEERPSCIFNITSGYKAIVPIFSVLGQLVNIPLQYIFDEGKSTLELDLIEVAPLPFIGVDWMYLDACKPFLRLDHPIWEKSKPSRRDPFLIQLKENQTNIGTRLLSLGLIKVVDSEKRHYKLSILGLILQQVPGLSGERGKIMEYLFFHYFAQVAESRPKALQAYSSFTLRQPKSCFRVREDGNIEISTEEKKGFRAIGDIDLPLLATGNTLVLGEVKPVAFFRKFSSFKENVQNAPCQKFYDQLRARLHYFSQHRESGSTSPPFSGLELLLLVYDFQFTDYKEEIFAEEREYILQAFHFLKCLEKEIYPNGKKPSFRMIGVKCLIDLEKTKVLANYTYFFQQPSFAWETEKLNSHV